MYPYGITMSQPNAYGGSMKNESSVDSYAYIVDEYMEDSMDDDYENSSPVFLPTSIQTIDDSQWGDETALVFDLDETGIHTLFDIESLLRLNILKDPSYSHLRSRIMILDFYNDNGDLSDNQMWTIKRPHIDTFLNWATKAITYIIVWSAGKGHYVNRTVHGLFTDAGHPYPAAVLSREDCYTIGDDRTKPLDLLYEKLPWLVGRVKRKNMVLLDDREYNFIMNDGRGLLIEPYEPKPTIKSIEANDTQLLNAIVCLKRRFGDLLNNVPVRPNY